MPGPVDLVVLNSCIVLSVEINATSSFPKRSSRSCQATLISSMPSITALPSRWSLFLSWASSRMSEYPAASSRNVPRNSGYSAICPLKTGSCTLSKWLVAAEPGLDGAEAPLKVNNSLLATPHRAWIILNHAA